MSLVGIRSEIIEAVQDAQVAAGIAAIYYDMPTRIITTPAVAILTDAGGEEYATTAQNALTQRYVIRCMVEKKEESSDQDATETTALLTMVDAILDELRKDDHATLEGQSHSFLAPSWDGIKIGQANDVVCFYFDIIVEAKTLKLITN